MVMWTVVEIKMSINVTDWTEVDSGTVHLPILLLNYA